MKIQGPWDFLGFSRYNMLAYSVLFQILMKWQNLQLLRYLLSFSNLRSVLNDVSCHRFSLPRQDCWASSESMGYPESTLECGSRRSFYSSYITNPNQGTPIEGITLSCVNLDKLLSLLCPGSALHWLYEISHLCDLKQHLKGKCLVPWLSHHLGHLHPIL